MIALLALALLAAEPRPAAAQKVAVWTIQPADGISAGAAQVLVDVVATELAKTGRFQVVGRADLTALLVDARKAVTVARVARFTAPTEDALSAAVPGLVAELVAAVPVAGAPDAPATSAALLQRADALAKAGRQAEAVAELDRYPVLFPEGADRCFAAFKAGVAWEAAGKRAIAADRFAAVGADLACQKSGPNAAGNALARAGTLYEGLGMAAQASDTFGRLVALPGVPDPSLRAKVEAARMRLDGGPAR